MHDNECICTIRRDSVTNIEDQMSELGMNEEVKNCITTTIEKDTEEKVEDAVETNVVPLKTRSRLKLPGILPRRLQKKPLVFTTDPKVMLEFNNLFNQYAKDDSYHYCRNIVTSLLKIGQVLGDEEVLSMLKFLLLEIEEPTFISNEYTQNIQRNTKNRSPYYSWVTFFNCLEHLPSRFYNDNVDITALILLKCYEFLTLRADDDMCLRNLQETLEHITNTVINKVSANQRENLFSEILAGNLPCSSQHQYDAASLNHYLLRTKST